MNNKVKDHLGNEYNSIVDMCRVYDIDSNLFKSRYNTLKWSLEDSLTKDTIVTDHLGNEYSSIRDMCEAYNIDSSVFNNRYNSYKWSLEDCLTKPIKK